MIYDLVPLDQIAVIFTGPPKPAERVRTVLRSDGPLAARFVSVGALRDGHLDASEIQTVHAVSMSDLRPYRVEAGDLIVPARSTVIRAAIVPDDLADSIVGSTVIAIRCASRLAPRLLAAYFEHPTGQAALLGCSQSGTTQYNLTVRALKELRVPLPPQGEQERMVKLLEVADAHRVSARQAARIRYETALHIAVGMMTRADHADKGSTT